MRSPLTKYGYLWITAILFLLSLFGHWYYGWEAYINEQQDHQQEVKFNEYVTEMSRDTFENWQSEFLQLIWQVAGLSFLFFVGSPQSKEGDERKEEKLDLILKKLYEKNAAKHLARLDEKYPRQ